MTRSVRRRTKNRTSLVVWAAAIALAGACSGPASPTPGSTGGPSPSRATASVGARPSASVAASQPEVVLRPVDGAPLDETIVRSVVSTPSGFAAIGMAASGGSPAPFVLMGSPDGRRWERVTTGPSGPAFTYLAGGPLGWIASSTGAGGSLGTTALWFSTDGVAWERVADTSGSAMADLSNSETNPLSAGPVGFAIVGQVTEAGSSVSAAWFSRDGRTWTEAVSLHDRNVDRVLQVPAGFVAIAAGCCAGPETVAFSTDGRAWRNLATDPGSPFDPAAGQALISTAGSSIVALRSDPGGIGAFSGDTANAAGGAAIAWRHAASTDAAFDGAAVSTMIGGNGGALALGFDRASLAPIAWTSSDGAAWQRTALDAGLFGGGVPGLATARGAAAESTFVAVADRSSAAGDIRPQLWRSDDGRGWFATAGDALGSLPAVPSGPCPGSPPNEVDAFLAMQPSLWPVCFGSMSLRVRGFVANCECGGTTTQQATPQWLIDALGFSAFYLSGPIVSAATGPGGFGVMIDPAHPVTTPAAGTHVELTGHFDDPAATTCRVFPIPGSFGPVAPMQQSVAVCRRAFVVSEVRKLP